VSIFSVVVIANGIPKAFEEVSGLECVYAEDSNAPRVIISRFYTVAGAEYAFEDQVFSELSSRLDGQATACLYAHPLKNLKDAEEAGTDLDGTVIIWGVSDPDYYQVHIHPTGWSGLELNWKAQPEYARELRSWVVDYVTQIAQIQIAFSKADGELDVLALDAAIDKAQASQWAITDPKQFAPAYFLTALMFDESGDMDAAIQAYGKAIQSDPGYDQAYLNRGALYQQTAALGLARDDYNHLINTNSPFAADAYANRATLQGDWQAMKSDLLQAIERKPQAPEYYHLLGYTAIRELDVPTATRAYTDLLPHLTIEYREFFIEDLKNMAQDPGMQDTDHQTLIRTMIETLENAPVK
jgi:tetratricopeptide (TPR) repeat protein